MTGKALLFVLALLAVVTFLAPVRGRVRGELRLIDEQGVERDCPTGFATLVDPERDAPALDAILVDFAYAAAAGGPRGSVALVLLVALGVVLMGLWCRGTLCALRRCVVTVALGLTLAAGLSYVSCFLDGRRIQLGPEATGGSIPFVSASLHATSHYSTGLLSPRQLVLWHFRRGFSVVNVSDPDSTEPGREAQRFAIERAFQPPLLVTLGGEWTDGPRIVLVNVRKPLDSDARELGRRVRDMGGATFVAHPWSGLERPLGDLFDEGIDGAEIVNGVIHGGDRVRIAAQKHDKALVGVDEARLGPHVNALTLIPAEFARSPEGVARAIRERRTRVLYAVPGGTLSGEEWEAGEVGYAGAAAALNSLCEIPRLRRATWFAWFVLIAALWWVATRQRPTRLGIGERPARAIFIGTAVTLIGMWAVLSQKARAVIGPIPVPPLLIVAALLAACLLASSHALAEISRLASEETES